MKRITEHPLVRFIDGDVWRLEEPFYYSVGSADSSDVIVVPVGFETDFASIPRPFRWIYPKTGKYAPAAVVHDYLCVERTRSSDEAHAIFLEAMEVLNIPKLRREMFYRAVLLFGPRFPPKVMVIDDRRREQKLKLVKYGKRDR